MKAMEAVKEIMKKTNYRGVDLANALDISTPTLGMRLGQKNASVDMVNKMVRIMKYKVVLVPSEERVKDDWFVIE